MKSKNLDDGLKQYICYLDPKNKEDSLRGTTQSIWATSPEDAVYRLRGWEEMGFNVVFLHSMDDFKEKRAEEDELNKRIAEMEQKNSGKHAHVEVENV